MATTSYDVAGISIADAGVAWDVLGLPGAGTVYVDPAWDVIDAAITGRQLLSVTSPVALGAEPLTTVSLAAAAVGPSAFDTWTWRVMPGSPAVTLTTSGATATFVAPAAPDGVTVEIGVTGSRGATKSAEGVIAIAVYPHQVWIAGTTTWLPAQYVAL